MIYPENERTGCMLPGQIQNKINQFKRFDLGTKSTLSSKCRLDMGNIQFLGILDLSIKPKMLRFNFLVDFKPKNC